jgi:lipopolysaccharide transport system permease protein
MKTLVSEWRRWVLLGWYDVLARYRRTLLGPFWIVVSTAISILVIAFVYSSIFKSNLADFLPFIAVSIVFWNWINATLMDSCTAFSSYKSILTNHLVAPTSIIARVVARNLLVLLHNILVVIFVLLVFPASSLSSLVFFLPAVLLVIVSLFCWSTVLAYACCRYRDLQPVTASVLGLLFLVTPILWRPESLGERGHIAQLNPFTHVLQVLRGPMLDAPPALINWAVCGLVAGLSAVAAILSNRKYRHRLPFWL